MIDRMQPEEPDEPRDRRGSAQIVSITGHRWARCCGGLEGAESYPSARRGRIAGELEESRYLCHTLRRNESHLAPEAT